MCLSGNCGVLSCNNFIASSTIHVYIIMQVRWLIQMAANTRWTPRPFQISFWCAPIAHLAGFASDAHSHRMRTRCIHTRNQHKLVLCQKLGGAKDVTCLNTYSLRIQDYQASCLSGSARWPHKILIAYVFSVVQPTAIVNAIYLALCCTTWILHRPPIT